MFSVNGWCCGACPDATRANTTMPMSTISVAVSTSTQSSVRIDRFTGEIAMTRQTATENSAISQGAIVGVVCHRPMACRKLAPKMPAVIDVVMVNAKYAPSSDQPATTPARGPIVTPVRPNTDPAWLSLPHTRAKP